jgi:hypothetical protein
VLTIRRSKTDREGVGATVAVPFGGEETSQLMGFGVAGNHQIESEQLHDHEPAPAALDLGTVLKQEAGALGSAHQRVSHGPSVASSLRY